MRHSRGAVGTLCFKQCFRGFDPHPCCPQNPPCPPGLGQSGGAWEQEGSSWNCGIEGRCPQVLLEQPFSKAGRARVGLKGEGKETFQKGKKKKNQLNASVAGDVKAKEPPTQTRSRETRHSKPAQEMGLSGLHLKPRQGCSASSLKFGHGKYP